MWECADLLALWLAQNLFRRLDSRQAAREHSARKRAHSQIEARPAAKMNLSCIIRASRGLAGIKHECGSARACSRWGSRRTCSALGLAASRSGAQRAQARALPHRRHLFEPCLPVGIRGTRKPPWGGPTAGSQGSLPYQRPTIWGIASRTIDWAASRSSSSRTNPAISSKRSGSQGWPVFIGQ